MPREATAEPILELVGVGRRIDGSQILENISWSVCSGQHWVVLGANGSGKTTIARIASLRLHPTSGVVRVLGTELGRADIRPVLGRVGYAAAALADQLRPGLSALDVVMTAKYGALETWWHDYDDHDAEQALCSLARVEAAHLAAQSFGSLSSGERQRVLIARALMTDPALLILDEPTAGLDLRGREEFVNTLDRLAAEPDPAPMVLITHHVDEIPGSFTHLLLIADGQIRESGPLDDVLTAENLSATFGIPLGIERRHNRWRAWTDGN